MIVDVK